MNWKLTLLLLIVFAGISYYIYKSKQLDPNRFIPNDEFKSIEQVKEVELMLFSVDWCPHCFTTRKVWDSFKSSYKPEGYIVTYVEIDCDKYTNTADSYNISEYPTIILVKNDIKYIYDAEISSDSLELFINTVMKQK
uniref:Thioredoxin domain-containing protein n=1 Tax=viral metagenome TaxID=1070528 RepID=A0A6C0JMP6_9ZZZZ